MSVVDFTLTTAELGGNAFIVTLSGEADMYRAPELEQALEGVVGLGGTATVVDLTEVSFIDSNVMAVLVRHHARFRDLGGDLVIVTVDRRMLRTFEIAGLERLFRIERTLADGIAAIVSGAEDGEGAR